MDDLIKKRDAYALQLHYFAPEGKEHEPCREVVKGAIAVMDKMLAKIATFQAAPADEGEKCWERECADCPKLRLEKAKAQAALAEKENAWKVLRRERDALYAKLKSAEAVVEAIRRAVDNVIAPSLRTDVEAALSAHDKEKEEG